MQTIHTSSDQVIHSSPVFTTVAPHVVKEKQMNEKKEKSGSKCLKGTSFRYLSTSIRTNCAHGIDNRSEMKKNLSLRFLEPTRSHSQNTNTAARKKDIEVILGPRRTNAQKQVDTNGENQIKITASINKHPRIISKHHALATAKDLKK